MGKYLRSKHSYMKLEDDDGGCLWPWALYRIVSHHRWHGFKKLITYKKPVERKDKRKRKKRQPASMPDELQNMNSAKAIWNIFGYGLFRKKSNKTSIKPEDSSTSSPDLQQTKMKSFDEDNNYNRGYDSNAPTLLSLLKAYPFPKMINTSTNHQQASKTNDAKNSKEDESNLLELLRVNQDMFLNMLQDGSSKNPKLVKSGTFPSPNRSRNMVLGRTPSKVEHKHTEVWPMSSSNNNDGGELRRIKLQKLGRLASFNESFVRNNGHFDGNVREIYRKNLSKSLKLRNEKDFMLIALSELPRASLERLNSSNNLLQTRGLSFKFGKDSGENVDDELHGDVNNKDAFVVEPLKSKNQQEEEDEEDMVEVISIDGDFDMNDEMISLGCSSESSFEDDETLDNAKSSNTKDTLCVSKTTPSNENVDETINSSNDNSAHFDKGMDYYCNQDLLYVKYILDVMGFSSGTEDPNPLDPAIFDAIEICCPFEPMSKSSILNKDANFDTSIPSFQRKLLFDLVNEALNYILEQSNGYYPKALSSICHVRPMLKGENRVVDELLEYVSDCLSWRPELDQTLKFAILHEISNRRTGWMNLQKDSESVALELENLIFDELLDEIVYGDLCE